MKMITTLLLTLSILVAGTAKADVSSGVTLVNSKIKLFGSSSLRQTGAATVNINMSSGSVIQIGDGTTSSTASYILSVAGADGSHESGPLVISHS